MPDPTSYPLTNYYFLLKTENLNPLIDAINQISEEITHNQTILDSLSSTIIKENTLSSSSSSTTTTTNGNNIINDPLHYLLEQKYNLPKRSNKLKNSQEYIEYLLNDINKLKKIQYQKKLRNKELYKILNKYQDEIINNLLPGLRQLINDILINKNNMIKSLEDKKNHVVINQIYNDYLNYVRFVWNIFDKLKTLCELMNQ
ncbi:predicted protein [Candida tropicalis MYA-3404]|uniref:Uncharacterized protein n=1 Tax=Candida tropicalis (strain ATCC MYA-3404 / T1) TaxID=294747 RepID=C5M3G8_CANTT|nr:predicted protein [Candida tropicalis MYA-3404]EER35868.1 predicted protein [Candida tropicalis MYA-3404]KAG4409984.1 hypothetical protein JTP64_000622 [Candida tropicalis]